MKRQNYSYAIYFNSKAKESKHVFIVGKNNKANDFKYEKLKLFSSKAGAEGYVQHYVVENECCARLFKSRARAFECMCEEQCHNFFVDPSEQIEEVIGEFKNDFEKDFLVVLPGRNDDELSFAMIHELRFWGFGYVPKDEVITSREQWNDYISYQFWYPEANGIIKNFLAKNDSMVIDI